MRKTNGNGGRRKPDRQGTEAALLDAALQLMERDGILSGLNMQETADAAGVNRGLIHHYFGSRRALLRAALDRGLQTFRERYEANRMRSATEKAALSMEQSPEHKRRAQLVLLLGIDGDDEITPIPSLADRVADIEREKGTGDLPADLDAAAMLAVWECSTLSYTVLRDQLSRQLGIPATELDKRFLATLRRLGRPKAAETTARKSR